MLIVKSGREFSAEEKYIISLLFRFLDVDFRYANGEGEDFVIENGEASIWIRDVFFKRQKEEGIKYSEHPSDVIRIDICPWFEELCFPYGENRFDVSDKHIYCGGDIFGSAFFMLTRWEELMLPKDKFGRCDETEMFVVKHGLYKRPIVNEYIALLRKMLGHIGVEAKGGKHKYHPFITHDVDDLFRFASVKNLCKNLAGDILHRKSLRVFFQTCQRYLNYQIRRIKDPFDTFDELMDWSEQYSLRDAFYFMPTHKREYDTRYDIRDKRVKAIVENIVRRGHEVGIHPSKNTFHDPPQFKEEVSRLKKIYEGIQGGRQHYLLYSLPETLRTWAENGLAYDAGIGFAFRGGFRCGICYPYPFFDVKKREILPIIIRPLIAMEGALFREYTDLKKVKHGICLLSDQVKKYDGEFVFLWHTNNLHRLASMEYIDLYKEIVTYIAQK